MSRIRSFDEQIVRVACIGFNQLFVIASCFTTPKAFQTVSKFAVKNIEHLFTDKTMDKEWSKVRIADMHQLDIMTNAMIKMMWLTLTLGKYINSYRRNAASTTVNWIEAATEFDKRRNANAKELSNGPEPTLQSEFDLTEKESS